MSRVPWISSAHSHRRGRPNVFEPALRAILDAGHTARFVARGDSMHPAIRDGEAVYVEPCTAPLLVGEVVLARPARRLTTHRIVSLRQLLGEIEILKRGANLLPKDPPLTRDVVVG